MSGGTLMVEKSPSVFKQQSPSVGDNYKYNLNSNELAAKLNSEKFQPKHITAPLPSYGAFNSQLSVPNRKYWQTGTEFKGQYNKLRILTKEEEILAGKFSYVGKKIEKIAKALSKKLGRDITRQELAVACRLTELQLKTYINAATKARNRLVQHNLRFVDQWVRKIMQFSKSSKSISYFELVAEGVVGLAKAAENYDGRVRFQRYAEVWVRSEIYSGITRLKPGSIASHGTMLNYFKTLRKQRELFFELGRNPTQEELASALGMKIDTLLHQKKAATMPPILSIDAPIDSTSQKGSGAGMNPFAKANAPTYQEMLKASDGTDHIVQNTCWHIEFQRALEHSLSPMERRTVMIRYGLLDGHPRNVERTAELMCITPEGVRTVILRAMEKLKNSTWASVLEEGPPQDSIASKLSLIRY